MTYGYSAIFGPYSTILAYLVQLSFTLPFTPVLCLPPNPNAPVRHHNHQIRQEGGVRLLTCLLPSKSPWLNPMEPIWLHAKRKVAEPDGDLSVNVLKDRLCSVFGTTLDEATLKPSG